MVAFGLLGILTEGGAADWHPAPLEVHEAGRKIRELGMRSIDEVKQNLEVLGEELDWELLAEIEALVAPVRNLNWTQGHPEYNDPGTVPGRYAIS
jgi:hypothetical protein